MEWGYEEKFDLLGIWLMDENYDVPYNRSIELKENLIIDIDQNEDICSIQVANWSKMFGIPKNNVSKMDIDYEIKYGEFSCIITVIGKLNGAEYKISGSMFL